MDYNFLINLTKKELINICKQLSIRPCNMNMTKKKIVQNILKFNEMDILSDDDNEINDLAMITQQMYISSNEEQLKLLNKTQLIDKCRKNGIKCNMSMNKDVLIDLILYHTDFHHNIPGWIQDLSLTQLESIRRDIFENFTVEEKMFWYGGNIEQQFPIITNNNKEEFKLFFTKYLENLNY